jgi:hypothetical protein
MIGNVIQPNGASGGGGYEVITTKEITKSSLQYSSEDDLYYNPTSEFSASEVSAMFNANLLGAYVYTVESTNVKSWGDTIFSIKEIPSNAHFYQVINDGGKTNPHTTVGDIRIIFHGLKSTNRVFYQTLLKQSIYDYLESDSKFVIKVVKIA